MKRKILWIIVIILLIIIIGVIITFKIKKTKSISSITKLHFNYSNGYMANAYTTYDIELKEGKYNLTIKPYLIPEEDAYNTEIDKETIDKIIEVLNKYEVNKWNGFKKSDNNVSDGDSFLFWVYMEDGSNIQASGYMMWPKNYFEVKNELNNILGSLYPKDKK